MTSYKKSKIPVMHVGKYAGVKVDQLPNSYLRWMLLQDFPKEYLECAKRKLDQSQFDNSPIHISRHALDMFSLRFLATWTMRPEIENEVGIATFVARLAQEAWDLGKVTTQRRHQDDGPRRDYKGLRFVYKVSSTFPEYKEVLTVMVADN